MNRWRAPLLAGAALLAAPLLSGCVAAAIPVLAAGGVLGTQVRGDKDQATTGQPRVEIDLARADAGSESSGAPGAPAYSRQVTLADGTRMEVMAGPLPPRTSIAQPAPEVASADPVPRTSPTPLPTGETYELAEGTRARLVGGVLPPPSGAPAGSATVSDYSAFAEFAERQGTLPIAGGDRRSALLADPGALAPTTRECSIHPAAVLIDLDPGAGVLDPAAAMHADARLSGTLAALRAEQITIGWLSAATADRAGAVRRALVSSGLDPAGRDELVLLRFPEERKQTRREDFGKEYCVVAIAGDERGDFDELFQYLKNPLLAGSLEALIGNGWFLIPQPLT